MCRLVKFVLVKDRLAPQCLKRISWEAMKMPTIARVKWPDMGIDYGWMFKISTYSDLLGYWQDVRQNRLQDGFSNYLHSREFISLAGEDIGASHHLSHSDAAFLNAVCLAETMKDTPRGVVEIFCDITDAIYQGMTKLLQEKGHLYVNKNGGYFSLSDGMEETDLQEIESFVIPGQKIEIKQWPNGTHYYAYVGGVSVERDGVNKWDTKSQAYNKSKLWAAEHNISLENI